jgi:hypothetical protein
LNCFPGTFHYNVWKTNVFCLGRNIPFLFLRNKPDEEVNMRKITPLRDNWIFIKEAENAQAAAAAAGEPVTLPHTWNALDGQEIITEEPAIM